MPGPVSDSYDPEFGTAENARTVRNAVKELAERVSEILASERRYILNVVEGHPGPVHTIELTERELRIIRFGLEYAAEVI